MLQLNFLDRDCSDVIRPTISKQINTYILKLQESLTLNTPVLSYHTISIFSVWQREGWSYTTFHAEYLGSVFALHTTAQFGIIETLRYNCWYQSHAQLPQHAAHAVHGRADQDWLRDINLPGGCNWDINIMQSYLWDR